MNANGEFLTKRRGEAPDEPGWAQRRAGVSPARRGLARERESESAGGFAEYVFSASVGMARRAVPARVVAGGTNIRATQASEGVAPLHAARTSQRDVPTTLNSYQPVGQAAACVFAVTDASRFLPLYAHPSLSSAI